MKKYFVFLLLNLFVAGNLFAQKEGNNWCFGDSSGIDFNSSSPAFFQTSITAFEQGANIDLEPQASLSDSAGNLLYYTNGHLIWNKNHQLFSHHLIKDCYFSITNGVICLPFPNHDSLSAIVYIHGGLDSTGLFYSVINLNKNGGLGDIDTTQFDIPIILLDTIDERLTAVKHANGRDWWIIFQVGNSFYKSLLTPNGIQYIGEQQIGIGHKWHYGLPGEICFSNDGRKLLRVGTEIKAEVFDFDRCSGILFNQVTLSNFISVTSHFSYYGCAFSPSGNRIYISSYDSLYQFCFNGNTYDRTLVWVDTNYINPPAPGGYCMGQMELAPDGKIYISTTPIMYPNQIYSYYNQNLCVINQPDSCGLACDFQPYSYSLNGHRSVGGLPNMPNYNLGALVGSACDTLTSIQNENLKTKSVVSIYPNPATTEIKITNLSPSENQISIINLLGQQVKSIRVSNVQSTILPIADLPAGIYVVTIFDGEKIVCKKLVKE